MSGEMSGIPTTMRAVVLTGHGGLDAMEYREDWPTPAPGPGQALIKVAACGLNNYDINVRTGWYSKPVAEGTTEEGGLGGFEGVEEDDGGWRGGVTFPRIQGGDLCGTVAAIGPGAATELLGKRVLVDTWVRDWDDPLNTDKCGYLGVEHNGGFAEYTVIDARNVHPIECGLSDAELASFATPWVTAENMLDRAEVTAGDVVLVTGASGGVGTALVQLANRRGAETVALCGESKADAVRALGPAAVLPRSPNDLAASLTSATGRDKVDVVADVVGGPLWPQLIDVLRHGGRYTCSGAIAGPVVEFDLRTFYLRDLTFTGATVVPPGTFAWLVGYIERGEVRPVLASVFPLKDMRAAQEAFLAKEHVGNIVLSVVD